MDKEQVEREVQRTIDLMGDSPRVGPRPFFYTRLKARMEAHPGPGVLQMANARTVLAVAGVILLLAVNAVSLFNLASRTRETRNEESIKVFAEEYGLSQSHY